MEVRIEKSWKKVLQPEFDKPYFADLVQFVRTAYAKGKIFPPAPLIFNAFDQCPFDDVKVVIIGQDPYHGPGQAHGLCFSVNDGVEFPPSLINIFKEIERDLGIPFPSSGSLIRWANQGVLLLNATLNSAGTQGRLTSRQRLGNVYRCRYQNSCRKKAGFSIYALGVVCSAERSLYRQPATPCT